MFRSCLSARRIHTTQVSTLTFANSVDSDHNQWNNIRKKHSKFMHVSTNEMALRNEIELSNHTASMATVITKRFCSEMRNMPNVREGFQMTLTQTIHLVLHRSFLCCWYLASNFQSRIVNTPCFASIDTTLNHKNKLFILYTNLSLLQEKTIST